MRSADALRGVGLAADASPLMGGKARFGCARWLPWVAIASPSLSLRAPFEEATGFFTARSAHAGGHG